MNEWMNWLFSLSFVFIWSKNNDFLLDRMEYRIFQPIDPESFQRKWVESRKTHHRTDIYFLLPLPETNEEPLRSIQRSLKLRDQRLLEVKTRLERRPNGQEHWKKTVHAFKKFDPEDLQSMVDVLRHWHHNDVADQLEFSPPEIVCHVEKFLHGKERCEDGTLESTGLSLQFVRRADRSAVAPKVYFETFCFERSSLVNVDLQSLERVFSSSNLDPQKAMGYPEFLWQQYKAIITWAT